MKPDPAREGLRLGYACLNTRFPSPARTVRLANATPQRLCETLLGNLATLEAILRWNWQHGIKVFRLSSNTVPLASHPAVEFPWRQELRGRVGELGDLMRGGAMQLSTHPGPYTVLGSANEAVASATVAELEYHAEVLAAFGLDRSHKIVLHLGGGAQDRAAWIERFNKAFARLSPAARSRLTLENDERWSLADVLEVATDLRLPVVFDRFHHELLLPTPSWKPGSSFSWRRRPGPLQTGGRRFTSRPRRPAAGWAPTRRPSTSELSSALRRR